ncbi:GatB/YqeY domain-containing protein [Flavobacteriaceae bacterium]|nr:GatB/YqeY domain-containing protein [Flavobacteriaceae bacterium]MDC1310158.1 GatB/YqeY domain-containing protein [Flavobacteriaceae bacterium]
MSLEQDIMSAMKDAMRSKDQVALRSLRAVKSAIIIQKTETGSSSEMSEKDEMKLLQKLVKQRKDSADIFSKQNREDLAKPELEEVEVISKFLPVAMSESEIEIVVKETIASLGADGMKDMGRVMGVVSGKLAGKADGKTISVLVRNNLS